MAEIEVKYKKLRWASMPVTSLIGSFVGAFIINYLFHVGVTPLISTDSELYVYAKSIIGSISGGMLYCLIVNEVSPANKISASLIMIIIFSLILLSGIVLDFTILEREYNKIILGVIETFSWIIGAFISYYYLYNANK